jgi:hypothetical protein
VKKAIALVRNCFLHRGVSIAQGRYADAAQEIEVVLPVLIAQIDALSTDEEVRVALIGLEKEFILRCLDGC